MSSDENEAIFRGVFGSFLSPREILSDIELGKIAEYDAAERRALIESASYVVNYLAMPHPDLGRPGPVCPFVPLALQKDLVQLTAARRVLRSKEELSLVMGSFPDFFDSIRPESQDLLGNGVNYKAIIFIFNRVPTDHAPALIDAVQYELKPTYIRKGFLIGQFYPSSPARGLHNTNFRPCDAPMPSLAVRHITVFDAPFMIDRNENILGYLARFGDEGRQRLMTLTEQGHLDAARIGEIKEMIT
jgi:hypothetical protein